MLILRHRRTGNRTLLFVLRRARRQYRRRRHARLRDRGFAPAASAGIRNVVATLEFR
jgi:hypothetical protein